MAAALVVHLLGLVGTPPAVVFVGKLLAFSTAAEAPTVVAIGAAGLVMLAGIASGVVVLVP